MREMPWLEGVGGNPDLTLMRSAGSGWWLRTQNRGSGQCQKKNPNFIIRPDFLATHD